MSVSVKCQYGLRALFELSKRWEGELMRVPEIAEAQAIPTRFLENILNQLRQGGFVESRRGIRGGYLLARAPSSISVADVVKFIDGTIYTIDCDGGKSSQQSSTKCRLKSQCIFLPLWREAKTALENVYQNKSLQDLLDADSAKKMPDYAI